MINQISKFLGIPETNKTITIFLNGTAILYGAQSHDGYSEGFYFTSNIKRNNDYCLAIMPGTQYNETNVARALATKILAAGIYNGSNRKYAKGEIAAFAENLKEKLSFAIQERQAI